MDFSRHSITNEKTRHSLAGTKMKKLGWVVPLLGTILMGLSTWVLITLVELQTLVAMLQQEILNMDKVIGRIYAHMDRLMDK